MTQGPGCKVSDFLGAGKDLVFLVSCSVEAFFIGPQRSVEKVLIVWDEPDSS